MTPKPKAAPFEAALDDAWRDPGAPQPFCNGWTEAFVDYDDPPTDEQAEAYCEPCPLRELCLDYARAKKPYWGVYGGRVWIDGRQQLWLSRHGVSKNLPNEG